MKTLSCIQKIGQSTNILRMCVCMYVCMDGWMYARMCIYTYTYADAVVDEDYLIRGSSTGQDRPYFSKS